MSKTPLVERLRGGVFGINRIPLCAEAADRIEQLGTELAAAAKRERAAAFAECARICADLCVRSQGIASCYDCLNAIVDAALLAQTVRVVPVDIDRGKHRNVLDVWNSGMENAETLEMLWPKLIKAFGEAK